MAYGLSTPLGITGIIFVIIGIIMALIGIILLIVNYNKSKAWYIWFLLIVGIILAILGAIFMVIALSGTDDTIVIPQTAQTTQYVLVEQPVTKRC